MVFPDSHGMHLSPFLNKHAEGVARLWAETNLEFPGGLYPESTKIDSDLVLKERADRNVFRSEVLLRTDRVVGYYEISELYPGIGVISSLCVEKSSRANNVGAELALRSVKMCVDSRNDMRHFRAYYCPAAQSHARLYRCLGAYEMCLGELFIPIATAARVNSFYSFCKKNKILDSYKRFRESFSTNVEKVEYQLARRSNPYRSIQYILDGVEVIPLRFCVDSEQFCFLVSKDTGSLVYVRTPTYEAGTITGTTDGRSIESENCHVTFESLVGHGIRFGSDGDLVKSAAGKRTLVNLHHSASKPCEILLTVESDCKDKIQLSCLGSRDISRTHRESNVNQGEQECSNRQLVVGYNDSRLKCSSLAVEGAISQLNLEGQEILQYSPKLSKLGWIYPWKGGIFTISEVTDCSYSVSECPFWFEPWGVYPGRIGFGTALIEHRKVDNATLVRFGVTDRIYEHLTLHFRQSDEFLIKVKVTNRSNSKKRIRSGIFIFLSDTDNSNVAYEADGVHYKWTPFRFNTKPSKSLLIYTLTKKLRGRYFGEHGGITAFNVGVDGMHLLAWSLAELESRAEFEYGICIENVVY